MIKAIIFDYGNVISSVDNDRFLEKVSRATGKTGDELSALIRAKSDLLKRYETGSINTDMFYEQFVKSGGLDLTKDEFISLFTGRFRPIHETRELIRKLKSGYRLGLLSNTNELDFEYEIRRCGVFDLFDAVSVSFKIGAMKPDRKIYLDALGKLNISPQESVYIDDIKEYADAAGVLGINGIHYTSHEALAEALNGLGCGFE
ncbi:MAG: HAD family phosphatase [Nitrospirota bacterium]